MMKPFLRAPSGYAMSHSSVKRLRLQVPAVFIAYAPSTKVISNSLSAARDSVSLNGTINLVASFGFPSLRKANLALTN